MARLGPLIPHIILTMLAAGCVSARYYVPVAEGVTTSTLLETLPMSPRNLTAFELMTACRDAQPIERLEISPPEFLELRVGDRFPLNTIGVVGVNGAGLSVAGVPVAIDVEEADPPVLQLRSDDPDLNRGLLLPIQPGIFRLRVRTICTTPGIEVSVNGLVR